MILLSSWRYLVLVSFENHFTFRLISRNRAQMKQLWLGLHAVLTVRQTEFKLAENKELNSLTLGSAHKKHDVQNGHSGDSAMICIQIDKYCTLWN